MRGNVDLVSVEGLVEGWCWNEQAPDDRVTVSICVDGEECGRAVACHFRQDLQEAGIGDGGHFFRLLLPDTVLRHRRSHKVALVDPATGKTIGEPYTVRFEYGLRFDTRLSDLEARSRRIESRIKELRDASAQRNASAELFAVVGAFFQQLSDDLADGTMSTPELQLGAAIKATTRALSPIAFPASTNPHLTVFVEANCSLSQLHSCLTALRHAATGVSIRVIILDTGSYEDASLICTLAHGVQYIRLSGDVISELRHVGAGDPSSIMVFLSGYSLVDPVFLTELRHCIEQNPLVGAVGGYSLDSEGRLHLAGFRIDERQLVDCAFADDPLIAANPQAALPAHALSHVAVAFRRKALEAAGGLDPIFGDELWAAVIDLCFRLRVQGWSIFSKPNALFSLSTGKDSPSAASTLATPSRAKDLLLHRWVVDSDATSISFAGYAAVVGQPDQMEDEMDAVCRLRTAGFSVHYLAADGADTGKIEAFQQAGAHIVPNAESLSDIPARIIFAATERGGTERLKNEAVTGGQLVTGLPSLAFALEHTGTVSLGSPNA